MKEKGYKSDSELSLVSISIPFLFMALTSFAASIINTMALALVPNNGVVYSESVGAASRIFNVFMTLCTFVIGGIGVVVAQRVGRKEDIKNIQKAVYTSLLITILFSLSIFAISEIISPFVLYGFLKPGTEQYQNGMIYIEVIAVTIILSTVKSAIGAVVNSYGFVKHTIIWNILGIILDAGLTLLFVLGVDLGVVGSALGTIIANVVTLIYAIIIFNNKIMKFSFKSFKIDKVVAKELFKISVPIGFEKISFNFAMLVVGILVAQIGLKFPDVFSFEQVDENGKKSVINLLNLSNTIIQTFAGLTYLLSIAFSQGASIISARKMGIKDIESVSKIVKKSFFISLTGDVIMTIILFFLQPYLIQFFMITQTGATTQYLSIIRKICFIPFLLMIFLQVGRTTNIIYLVGPTAYGNLIVNSIFSVINTWLVILIFGLSAFFCTSGSWGNMMYGMNMIYILMALDEIFRGAFNYYWWKSGRWNKEAKKMQEKFLDKTKSV